ncbi:MAG: hypothetical protein NT062_23025 [Proteobacteria bacterium]|nr:hypothetical protein [Pseudomonadota bacterium]
MELSVARVAVVTLLGGVIGGAIGCHPPAPRVATTTPPLGVEVTLFRDGVAVREVIAVEVGATGRAVVPATLPPNVDLAELLVTPETGPLAIAAVASGVPGAPIAITVNAPRPGRYALAIAYTTTAISWEVAYTMTTDAARRHARLRGAIAIRNASGVDLAPAHVEVIDTTVAAWRQHAHEQLRAAAITTRVPAPRSLGTTALPRGETRLAMLADEPPRAMRSVLVYDPFGTTLDSVDQRTPLTDAELGRHASSRVTESFEITRPTGAAAGDLPSGPLHLLAQLAGGALVVIGESRFDASTRAGAMDTIAVGTAEGVTAKRTQVELTSDPDNRRLVEDFELELANTRAQPIDVVVREHAYRGPAWTVGYATGTPAQAGDRAFTLHVHVPARGTAKSFHTIVYTWAPP